MSYCMFENTADDVLQCARALRDAAEGGREGVKAFLRAMSPEEIRGLQIMMMTFRDMEDELSTINVSAIRDEVESGEVSNDEEEDE